MTTESPNINILFKANGALLLQVDMIGPNFVEFVIIQVDDLNLDDGVNMRSYLVGQSCSGMLPTQLNETDDGEDYNKREGDSENTG